MRYGLTNGIFPGVTSFHGFCYFMPLPARPQRDPATQADYQRRTGDLIRRCRRELKVHQHEALDYRRFVGWLITQKTQWSRPTWRQYKAAVAYVLETKSEQQHDPIAQEALETLLPVTVEGCPPTTKKTSGSKLKRFPLKDYRQIMRELEDHPNQWAMDLQRWISCSILTGLRPREWSQAKLTTRDGEPALVVTNAKATNQRAHGPTRTILLGGLTDDERDLIKKHLERASVFAKAGQFPQFYHGCAAVLARTVRRLWPKRGEYVTLYSTRHQFSADAKASGLLPEELAALMGHAVDTTATKHYGKKTAGFDMIRVRPDPKEVARVRSALRQSFRGPGQEPQPSVKNLPKLRPNQEQGSA